MGRFVSQKNPMVRAGLEPVTPRSRILCLTTRPPSLRPVAIYVYIKPGSLRHRSKSFYFSLTLFLCMYSYALCTCFPLLRGYNIIFRVSTFAKPECNNALQPDPRSDNLPSQHMCLRYNYRTTFRNNWPRASIPLIHSSGGLHSH